ncbi:MAG TPA: glycosyltransferase family A protein, partial [Bacteroidales bacterium]|nr:glycosyltransferase family A protein [Bacteroidales bacterium]
MSFANGYLAGSTISGRLFEEKPDKNTGIIIIIPAFDEPGIIFTLRSIEKCYKPPCPVELIVLVNAPAGSNDEQLRQNKLTMSELSKWKSGKSNNSISLHYYDTGLRNDRQWGVGMARKMAMDEALRRFNDIDNPGGVIVSLDADCRVSENYLLEIYNKLYLEEKRKACSIGFKHPLSGDLSDDVYRAVSLYELHLRYYYQALKYTGFPHV